MVAARESRPLVVRVAPPATWKYPFRISIVPVFATAMAAKVSPPPLAAVLRRVPALVKVWPLPPLVLKPTSLAVHSPSAALVSVGEVPIRMSELLCPMTTVPWLSNDDVWRKRPAPLEGKVSVCALSTSRPPASEMVPPQPRHGGGEVDRAGPGERGVE